jgi:hypothetical protein
MAHAALSVKNPQIRSHDPENELAHVLALATALCSIGGKSGLKDKGATCQLGNICTNTAVGTRIRRNIER